MAEVNSFRNTVRVIPHSNHRYPTVGDWWYDYTDKTINVAVSNMGDWRKEFLVTIHELIEAAICMHTGVKEEDVNNFDIAFEANRPPDDFSEPGDQPSAPYHNAHIFATKIEKELAIQLGVNWDEYETEINNL